MPPLIPSFMLPKALRDAPTIVKIALLGPALLIGGLIGLVVQTIMINLGAGNQHLSSPNGGFEEWLIWIIAGLGLFLGLGIGGFIYFGVGRGGEDDLDDEDEDAHEGETGLLEL